MGMLRSSRNHEDQNGFATTDGWRSLRSFADAKTKRVISLKVRISNNFDIIVHTCSTLCRQAF